MQIVDRHFPIKNNVKDLDLQYLGCCPLLLTLSVNENIAVGHQSLEREQLMSD